MEPFDVKISFTGVCGYFPRQESWENPGKVCVLMPHAGLHHFEWPGATTFDGLSLDRHVPILVFRLKQTAMGAMALGGSHAAYYLNGLAVKFKRFDRSGMEITERSLTTSYTSALDRHFGSDRALKDAGGLEDAKAKDLAWLPKMSLIVPNAEYDPLIETPQSTEKITSRILLDHGNLRTEKASLLRWEMKPPFKDSKYANRMTHRVVLEMRGIYTFQVQFIDLRDGETVEPPLTISNPGVPEVELDFHSACDLNPLAWTVAGIAGHRGKTISDHDFRWNYEMLAPRLKEDLGEELKGGWFKPKRNSPIPEVEVPESGGVLSTMNNCIGFRGKAIDASDFWNIFC